jgi:hypothetical protein
MAKTAKRRIGWIALFALALPGVVSAGYFCYSLGNGCTQCENYAPDGQYQGYMILCP